MDDSHFRYTILNMPAPVWRNVHHFAPAALFLAEVVLR